ncbi:MAG: ATP-dependent helicase [Terriglobales bacterium]
MGTIHAFCFRLLQEHADQFGNFDLMDDHRLAALLSRESRRLRLHRLGDQHWRPIQDFLRNAQVVENERVEPSRIQGAFGDCYRDFCLALERYRVLTYGQIITRALDVLSQSEVAKRVHGSLRHLIVDEYQDVNPAQEELIRRLTAGRAQLCVVGDDDQAIYQWRGSDIGNMLTFPDRYPGAKSLTLSLNRRSTPEIVTAANGLACRIKPRLSKNMQAARPASGLAPYYWTAEHADAEAGVIADHIGKLHVHGFAYRDIAVLFRSVRTSAPPLLQTLRERRIPFQCAGRTGLFLQPEAQLLGQTYAWICGNDWKDAHYSDGVSVELPALLRCLGELFGLDAKARSWLKSTLENWKRGAAGDTISANVVGDYYRLLRALGVQEWNLLDAETAARAGSLARFSSMLADFEHARRRARSVTENGATVHRGGSNTGTWFYRQLFNYLQHYALDAYEDFAGEDDPALDAVNVLTVHQSKGLEWPVVFVPALTNRRFPSSKAGRAQSWLLSNELFPPQARRRYEGSEPDERRLFYVGVTRARDALYLSRFFRTAKQRASPSPFCADLGVNEQQQPLPLPPRPAKSDPQRPELAISFSDLVLYEACGHSYRLRRRLGFEPQLASEIGFGRAVHNVLRALADLARRQGRAPSRAQADRVLATEFYLPFANLPAFEKLKDASANLVHQYLRQYAGDLLRAWETERPIELRVTGAAIQGRADVIYEGENGSATGMALADYKTASDPGMADVHAFQLAIYAAGARQQGLDVRAAYVHDLDAGIRTAVPVGAPETAKAVQRAESLVEAISARRFPPQPERKRCAGCDVRPICGHAAG